MMGKHYSFACSGILTILFCFFFSMISGQNHSLTGVLVDDLNLMPVTNAAVTVWNQHDSLLAGFTRTDTKGRFRLDRLDTIKYNVTISYPDFVIYFTDFTISPGTKIYSLDTVTLLKNDQLLGEITIVDNRKVQIKGDTIQFVADSFKVGESANVEDLLKKLDGLSVNSKGEITAFGQKVERVLVDGEEFFGSDPTIATRNIQAKAVDKVQVFDKTSDMEALTGIPDDEKVKAINLTLKEEYKKGYFGKVSAGVGQKPTYHDATALAQGYTGNSKVAAYGVISNTGTTGLNFDDKNTFIGNSGNMTVTDGGGIMITVSDDDEDFSWDGRYNGEGLPNAKAAGGSFTNKSSDGKIKFNINYGYSDQNLTKTQTTNSTQFLPGGSFQQRETEVTDSRILSHSLNTRLDAELDSFTTLIFKGSGGIRNNSNRNQFNAINSEDALTLTDIDRRINSEIDRQNLKGDFDFVRKFKKKRRLLTLNATYGMSQSEGETYYNAHNNFLVQNFEETLDQLHLKNATSNSWRFRTSYTEPISKTWVAQAQYYFNYNKDLSEKLVSPYEETSQGYIGRIDSLSNDFDYMVRRHGGGLTFAQKKEKYNLRLGANVEKGDFLLKDLILDNRLTYDRLVWMPVGSFSYNFSRTTEININYSGSTKQPTISQIQPVRDNTNPLNQAKGNPDLDQAYYQSVNLWFSDWKSLAGRSLWAYAYFSNTFNDIVSNNYVDESGRNIYSYLNAEGNYNMSGRLNYSMRFAKNFRFISGLNFDGRQHVSFVNSIRSAVKNSTFGTEVGLNMEKEDVCDFGFTYNPAYTITSGGLVNNSGNFWGHNGALYGTYHITPKLSFRSNLDVTFQPANLNYSEDLSRWIWNANLAYMIDKAKTFELKLAGYDLLNQNVGYRRFSTANYVTENGYNTIRRYVMIHLAYHIKSKT